MKMFLMILPVTTCLLSQSVSLFRKALIYPSQAVSSTQRLSLNDEISTTNVPKPVFITSSAIFANLHSRKTRELHPREWSTYQNAAEVDKFNLHIQPILSLAFAEFKDWIERTIARNVYGNSFEFDRRQWQSSVAKWWARAIEADEQARLEFARQYFKILRINNIDDPKFNSDVSNFDTDEDWDLIYFDCESLSTQSSLLDSNSDMMRVATIPVHIEEVVDCAVHGKWHVKYDESGAQIADYQPQ
jgi:hypothetical protein